MTMSDSAYPVRRTSPAQLELIFILVMRWRHAFNQFGETPEKTFAQTSSQSAKASETAIA